MWFRRILADFLLPGPKTRTGAKLLKGPFQIFLYVQENLEYLSTVLLEEESVAWLQFIKKAVAHNAAEIQRVFILHGLAELSLTWCAK